MPRTDPHKIETKSKDIFRCIVNSNEYCDALVRDITENDYGIDFIVELFENKNPTGMISYIQLKGTNKKTVRYYINNNNIIHFSSCTLYKYEYSFFI